MADDEDDPLGPHTIHPNDPRYEKAKRSKSKSNGSANEKSIEYVALETPLRERDWAVPGRIPNCNVTLIYGDGAIGKSLLLLHLAVCYALNANQSAPQRDWLGALPYGGNVLKISCEEDDDELRRRLQDVADFYQVTRAEISKNLKIVSWVGEDSTLCHASKAGIGAALTYTQKFKQLSTAVLGMGPRPLIILDTVADMFGASENDRVQVRSFITSLRALAIATNGAIVLAAHPSVTGMANESGLSGSTGWNNSVRARAYFRRPKKDDIDDEDDDIRLLEWKKANYAKISETLQVRYKNGVFVLNTVSPIDRAAAEAKAENVFMEILYRMIAAGQNVSSYPSPTYAPAVFAKQNEARNAKVKKFALEEAMQRLFKSGKIEVETTGSPSRQRSRIVPRSA